MKKVIFITSLLTLIFTNFVFGQFNKVFDFPAGFATKYPTYVEPVKIGDYIYSTSSYGGDNNKGTIMKIKTDGTEKEVLYSFSQTTGSFPDGGIITDGTYFYGATREGGSQDNGTVYKINIDGSGYEVLHHFTSAGTRQPYCSPILIGSSLYGTTLFNGTVYKINTDGTGFEILHDFGTGATGTIAPLSTDGIVLYGATWIGGGNGNVFKINTDGTGYQSLHSFNNTNGKKPYGGLYVNGTELYGMTYEGGTNSLGVIYKIDTDGTDFELWHNFSNANGSKPCGSFALSGNELFGFTSGLGSDDVGYIFKINTDGTGFSNLYTFDDVNGRSPRGTPYIDGTTIYGFTMGGGQAQGGTAFFINTDGTSHQVLAEFNIKTSDNPDGKLVYDGEFFYGTSVMGGTIDRGTVFKIKPDGTEYQVIYNGDYSLGTWLYASPTLSGDYLYVVAFWIDEMVGSILKIKTDGTETTVLHSFDNLNTANGSNPETEVIIIDEYLYGTTAYGGNNEKGIIYKIKNDGTEFQVLKHFETSDGSPCSGLIYTNSKIFGTTGDGGNNSDGIIYSINTDGSDFSAIHHLSGWAEGNLIEYNNILYGTTRGSSNYENSTIFSINTDGSDFNLLHTFTDIDGIDPYGELILSNNFLYGMTSDEGYNFKGTIFKIGLNGSNFTKLHDFNSPNGENPRASFLNINDVFYALANGGENGLGVMFSYTPTFNTENDILTFTLPEQTGNATINPDNHTVEIEVTNGTNVGELTPTITISDFATIDPATGTAQDFSAPFEYTVTAENGDEQVWTVTVTVALNSGNDILTFTLLEQTDNATINTDNHTVEIEVETGTNVSELTPTITISDYATINPNSGTQQNFSAPFEYTVTAENGDEQVWTVTVIEEPSNITNLYQNKITIYPNPSNGTFFLNLPTSCKVLGSIKITDLTGKIIYNSKAQNLKNLKFDLSNQTSGIYFINIKTKIDIYSEKLIIQ